MRCQTTLWSCQLLALCPSCIGAMTGTGCAARFEQLFCASRHESSSWILPAVAAAELNITMASGSSEGQDLVYFMMPLA